MPLGTSFSTVQPYIHHAEFCDLLVVKTCIDINLSLKKIIPPFSKNYVAFSGITNDPKDPSVDTFKFTTLKILSRFGVPSDGLKLKIESRGVPPLGGGEVVLDIPTLQSLNVSF